MRTPIAGLAAVIPHYRNPGPLPARERFASGIAGASLFLSGWRRGGLGGLALALVGADLLYRGFHGGGHIYDLVSAPKRKLLEAPRSSHETATPEAVA